MLILRSSKPLGGVFRLSFAAQPIIDVVGAGFALGVRFYGGGFPSLGGDGQEVAKLHEYGRQMILLNY